MSFEISKHLFAAQSPFSCFPRLSVYAVCQSFASPLPALSWSVATVTFGLRFHRCPGGRARLKLNDRELELTNLLGLVLGCIEAKFCKQVLVGIRIYLKRILVGKLSPNLHNALLCTAFGIHNRKLGKKGPGQNNPEKRRKQENERPISGPQQAT